MTQVKKLKPDTSRVLGLKSYVAISDGSWDQAPALFLL